VAEARQAGHVGRGLVRFQGQGDGRAGREDEMGLHVRDAV